MTDSHVSRVVCYNPRSLLFSSIAFKPATNNNTTNNNQHNNSNNINGSTSNTSNTNNSNTNGNNNSNTNGNTSNNSNGINNHDGNNNQSNHHSQSAGEKEINIEPKNRLCDPDIVILNWQHSERVGSGLVNVGNTCFLNSVLQCLTYCPPLVNFLINTNGGHSSGCKISDFCMLCEMERHIKRIRSSTGYPVKPIYIYQRLKYISKSFQFGRQEDAHEFLRYLIDHMWKACLINNNVNGLKLDARIKETTVINHIFGGYHRSQVVCLTCKSKSNTYDFFMDFILDIRNAPSLEKALEKFTQPETLQNDNAYKCSKCKKKVAAKKRFTVHRAPNVATFQFKRFDSNRIFGGKITKHITYPEELDLRPYMSDTTKPSIKYNLNAVLVHVGQTSNSGHYYCFIRNSNGFWYRMDDASVNQVSKDVVLGQQAYVLFYTRKSDSKISTTNNIATTASNTATTITTPKSITIHSDHEPTAPITNGHKVSPLPQTNGHKQTAFPQTANSSLDKPVINGYKSQVTTWSGDKSQLDSVSASNKRKSDDISDRDEFNEELDRGKIKKIKSHARDERFFSQTKYNPFQRFSNNGYRHNSNHYPHNRHNRHKNHKRDNHYKGKNRHFGKR